MSSPKAGTTSPLLVSMGAIYAYSAQVAALFKPERIILFGSWARGDAGASSDVDLLVVMPFEGKGWQQAALIRSRVRATFPLDLLVRSPAELAKRLVLKDVFISDILQNGKVLHDGTHSGMGRQS